MAELGVNIDHVATVRQARHADEPDPAWAAVEAQLGGADCITFHLREDRRHIVDRDVPVLREVVNTKLNMELALDRKVLKLALQNKPDQATLVPERREELTTEGGLDVARLKRRLKPVVDQLRGAGITTSAFVAPTEAQIEASHACGFEAIELWTGDLAHANTPRKRTRALRSLQEGIRAGLERGLVVHAGHGLTYRNVQQVACLPGLGELNIGHSIVARAVFVGMREAVREMKRLIDDATPLDLVLADDVGE